MPLIPWPDGKIPGPSDSEGGGNWRLVQEGHWEPMADPFNLGHGHQRWVPNRWERVPKKRKPRGERWI